MSVCPSVCSHGTIRLLLDEFLWNLVFEYFSKTCGENAFHENLTSTLGTLHEDLCMFMAVCRLILLGMRNVPSTPVEKIKTHLQGVLNLQYSPAQYSVTLKKEAVLHSSEMLGNTSNLTAWKPKRRSSNDPQWPWKPEIKHPECEANLVLCGGMPELTITSSWNGVLLSTEIHAFTLFTVPLRYIYIHTHTHVYIYVCVCIYIYIYILLTYLLHGAESFLRS
jgi:hypothetical protein